MATILAQPCGILRRTAPFRHVGSHASGRLVLRKAKEAPDGPSTSSAAGVESKEARVERLEASIRGKALPAPRPSPSGPISPSSRAKPIPIRGVSQPQNKIDSQYENMADWKEWQLFPEGWDSMPLGQKLTELYLGRRGILFWANKAAYASAFLLLGGWILFRFVGPALGLYKLAGELQPPPL
ncbi:hypothetical protein GPECTOR_46g196 [Gonium pectorale]|uniref:Uncharacterized protein n=1 Tax=Gonium pectorale TaxID=33097 RepID=A0A150G8F2_GONPE|nr:hypothetical protein GPECTOR_46g196 [Gonium pectorale]|eukprot:KXZ46127.1 hypothetical protein GPECTOR_46g196 [Gonium pectorale]